MEKCHSDTPAAVAQPINRHRLRATPPHPPSWDGGSTVFCRASASASMPQPKLNELTGLNKLNCYRASNMFSSRMAQSYPTLIPGLRSPSDQVNGLVYFG